MMASVKYGEYWLRLDKLCFSECPHLNHAGGVERYIEEGDDIDWEESHLPRLYINFSFNWHTFHHIHIVFRSRILISKHGMFWRLMPRPWRHNACPREFSAFHTLRCIFCLGIGKRWRWYHDVSSARRTFKIHTKQGHPLKIVSPICYNEGLKVGS